MNDFAKALNDWMTEENLSDRALGEMLDPTVTHSAIGRYRRGEAEPRRAHRGQLMKISKGKITHKHFT